MKRKLQQWGAALVVLGGASLILPAFGMQLRIFNFFGGGHTEISIAFIVVGAVLWLVGTASRGAVPVSAPPAPPPIGRGAIPAVTSVSNLPTVRSAAQGLIPPTDFAWSVAIHSPKPLLRHERRYL